jgi:hypothetical protein
MTCFAGLDVSHKITATCVVDNAGCMGPRGDDRRPNGRVALLRLVWLSLLPYRYCGRPHYRHYGHYRRPCCRVFG